MLDPETVPAFVDKAATPGQPLPLAFLPFFLLHPAYAGIPPESIDHLIDEEHERWDEYKRWLDRNDR
jgi:hypothetical protein